jgi:carboxyl-terminal processing protease
MPDVFVALDTTDVTDYFNDLVRGGHVNSFSLQYVNNNRETLKKTYPSFDVFLKSFATDENFMKEFFAYVEKEDPKLTMVETEYATSAKSIQIRIKSNIAQDLFGFSESYQIFNQMNEMVNKGIQLFNSKEYDVFDLAD